MTEPQKYGRRNVPKMYAQINTLRAAIQAEGTPAIQEAWDKVEEHIDFAYRGAEVQPTALRDGSIASLDCDFAKNVADWYKK